MKGYELRHSQGFIPRPARTRVTSRSSHAGRSDGMTLKTIAGAVSLAALLGTSSVQAEEGPGKGYTQIPPGAYSVVAEIRAKPGKEDALRAITLPLIDLVRGDPKNLVYF